MSWSTTNFGKHANKTLPQILFSDPDWFFYAYNNGYFNDKEPTLQREVKDIYYKSRNIRIPDLNGEPCSIEHRMHKPSRKYQDFDLVEPSRDYQYGSRENYLDMSYPNKYSKYDKKGFKTLLKCMKFGIFRDENTKYTKKFCEDFFENESNFKSK